MDLAPRWWRPARSRAPCWPTRAPGPFHVATLLDNVPEHVLWLGGAALAGACSWAATPRTGGRTWPGTWPTPSASSSSPTGPISPWSRASTWEPGIGTVSARESPASWWSTTRRPPSSAPSTATRRCRPARGRGLGVDEDGLGYLIFTSGTSGAPKACRCTQGRLARIGIIVAQMYSLTVDDVCFISMPLFHSNALMAGLAPAIAAGATIALPTGGRFSASGFLADVRRHGVTYFNYVGKPLSYILATPERPDDADNPLVRVFGNEGAEADVVRFGERFGCAVVDSYGSTEGGATVQRTPDTPHGALGRAPEGTMVVDPETAEQCPAARFDDSGMLVNSEEAVGELVSAGGAAGFEGYWHNDEAERARLRNGWYWTGDLAYRDEAGFFYFAGRSDDWLRVDGENFAAAPVARILERHPDVVLASVYAVPDRVVGDQVMAALQLRPEASFDADAFAAFLDAQGDLGTKWAPRYVRVCPELPITATSKVLVRTLRAERWNCADPVWWRPDRAQDTHYRPIAPSDVDDLEESVATR